MEIIRIGLEMEIIRISKRRINLILTDLVTLEYLTQFRQGPFGDIYVLWNISIFANSKEYVNKGRINLEPTYVAIPQHLVYVLTIYGCYTNYVTLNWDILYPLPLLCMRSRKKIKCKAGHAMPDLPLSF